MQSCRNGDGWGLIEVHLQKPPKVYNLDKRLQVPIQSTGTILETPNKIIS